MTAKDRVLEKYPEAFVHLFVCGFVIRKRLSAGYAILISKVKATESEAWEDALKRIEGEENESTR